MRANKISEDWQFCYRVKGLIAPIEGAIFDGDILVRGLKESDEALIFFRSQVQNKAEADARSERLMQTLENIVRIYGLIAREHVEVSSSRQYGSVSDESPFGNPKDLFFIEFSPMITVGQRKRTLPLLEQTIEKYRSMKSIFEQSSKSYLRNAIDYFYHALSRNRLEEKLIDLMIALESLFSSGEQELHLRYSLRAMSLLSIDGENEQSEIFELIYNLYKKRSHVVHGRKKVDLRYNEISKLASYVQEAIKRFFYIKQKKEKFLELLDKAVYDKDKQKKLEEIVSESLSRWDVTT